jgi:hypothetical protein
MTSEYASIRTNAVSFPMKGSITLFLVAIVFVASCAHRAPHYDNPSAFVEAFYRDYPRHLLGGLPQGGELRWIRPRVSDRLYDTFMATLQYQREWIARHPDEPSPDGGPPVRYKPPFAEGVPFDGSPDGHTSFKVVNATQIAPDTWHVRIHFLLDPSLAGWEHTVVVKSERGRYVLDDVLYEDPPARLSGILATRDPE